MKKYLFVIIAGLLMCQGISSAQGGQQGPPQKMKPEESAKKQSEWITKELKLDKETSEKVYQIELKKFNAMEEQFKNKKEGDREAAMAARQKIEETRDKEMKALLGEKNFETIKKKEEANRPQKPPQGGQGRPQGGNK